MCQNDDLQADCSGAMPLTLMALLRGVQVGINVRQAEMDPWTAPSV